MKSYDPFHAQRARRRKRVLWGLGVLALFAVAALVVATAWLGDRIDAGERAPAPEAASAPASPSAPESSAPAPSGWPTREAPSSAVTAPVVEEVDRGDPEAVAEAFALLSTTWDTRTDLNESAGMARAVDAYGAPELVLPPPPERPGVGWVEPAMHGAVSVPEAQAFTPGEHWVDPEGLVLPTGERVTPLGVSVSWGWEGVDENGEPWVSPDAGERVLLMSLVERGGQWQVVAAGPRPE